ncbi:uncharacterized protein LOC122501425 isoform X1 [Leptopilina heterotoma]|uniref:uncharacterized protein LOC122501425 isoform X1 n=2 Tax=Leptopilina heterotoma TaxID=63436 RepID=UPI001CA8FCAB|nr:uncharacterized protein LOC122501425 isoform X1 [Leptopilina heterotoma]
MIRIVFICILIALVSSKDCELSDRTVENLQQELELSRIKLKNQTSDKEDAAICIGTARSGKSTLINYLIRNKLKGVRKYLEFVLEKNDSNSIGPEIGSESESVTTEPSKWISTHFSNLAIWDTPGFGDTRGVKQDIINSYYIYNLVKSVQSLKFIVVVDFANINTDNTNSFLELLNNLEIFIGNRFQDFFKSISVIFSKVPSKLNGGSVNYNYFVYKIRTSYLNSGVNLSPIVRSFLEYLINNTNQIGIFYKVTKLGPMNPALCYNIVPAIREAVSQTNYIQDLNPSISESTKNCIYATHAKLMMFSSTAELSILTANLFQKKLFTNESEDYITSIRNRLSDTEEILLGHAEKNASIEDILSTLELVDESLKSCIEKNDMLKKVKLLSFFDYLLNTKVAEEVTRSFQALLWPLLYKIKDQVYFLHGRLHEIADEQHKSITEKRQKEIEELKIELESARNYNIRHLVSFLNDCQDVYNIIRRFLENFLDNLMG